MSRALPECLDWLDDERSTPIGPVAAMGQERNLLRRFVIDGRPIALNLHVIGDTRCQTNSHYAWGSGNALAGAASLSDVLAEHAGDPEAQALAFEARSAQSWPTATTFPPRVIEPSSGRTAARPAGRNLPRATAASRRP